LQRGITKYHINLAKHNFGSISRNNLLFVLAFRAIQQNKLQFLLAVIGITTKVRIAKRNECILVARYQAALIC